MLERMRLELESIRLTLPRSMVLHPGEIFYDVERANLVDQWGPATEKAADECDLMILLVSSHSLASRYCIPEEVRRALLPRHDGRPPATVVPVLLHATANWMNRELYSEGPNGKPLELGRLHAGGLPKGAGGNANNVTPISSWPNRAEAWAAVTRDLQKIIERRLFPTLLAPAGAAGGGASIALVTPKPPPAYLCNQDVQRQAFETAVASWKQQRPLMSLIIMLQGMQDDNLERFAERLSLRELKPRLPSLGLALREESLTMISPRPTGAGRLPGMTMLRELFEALDRDSLVGALDSCLDQPAVAAELLRAHLESRTDIAPVFCPLPAKVAVAEVQAFLGLLDQCRPKANEMGRLVLFCLHEVDPGIPAVDWSGVSLRSQWAHAQVLAPLSDIGLEEARDWHRDHRLEQALPRSEVEALFHTVAPHPLPPSTPVWRRLLQRTQTPIAATSPAPCRLRLGTFARHIERLLKGAGPPATQP